MSTTFEDVERARRGFSTKLREYRLAGGRYHHPAPELAPEKLAGCEVLPNRYDLLDKVAQGGVMAEIGVDRGDFSLEILTRLNPGGRHGGGENPCGRQFHQHRQDARQLFRHGLYRRRSRL